MIKAILFVSLALPLCFCSSREKKDSSESTNGQNSAHQESTDPIKLIGKPLEDRPGINYGSIQTIFFDLNSDGILDTLTIQKAMGSINPNDSLYYEWTDPGAFHRMIISIAGGKKSTFTNIGGWLENKELAYYDEDFNVHNLVESSLITVRDPGYGGSKLIFCVGYPYASEPGLLTIIKVINQDPKLIFNLNTFLFRFEDFNSDEILDIATTVWDKYNLEEQNKVDFEVYLLSQGCTLSRKYSQRLNDQF